MISTQDQDRPHSRQVLPTLVVRNRPRSTVPPTGDRNSEPPETGTANLQQPAAVQERLLTVARSVHLAAVPGHRRRARQDLHHRPRQAPGDRRECDLGRGYYAARIDPERRKRNHIRELEALGYTVTLKPAA